MIIGDMMSGTADNIISLKETQASTGKSMLVFLELLHGHVKCVNACSKEQLLYRIVNLKGNVVTNGSN